MLCFDAAGLQMVVGIFVIPAVEFDEEGDDGIMARFFIDLSACQAVPIILGIIIPSYIVVDNSLTELLAV